MPKRKKNNFQQISLLAWPYAVELIQGKGQEKVGVADGPIGSLYLDGLTHLVKLHGWCTVFLAIECANKHTFCINLNGVNSCIS